MKNLLTDRQNEILNFIHQFRDENGYPPTLREIGAKFDISSTFGVKRHLDALVKKGYLSVESNASRGIAILPQEEKEIGKFGFHLDNMFSKIPILGRVAAGNPITAIENFEGNIVVDSSFIKTGNNYFALKVNGDSMINAGILNGDFVVVVVQNYAEHNEIIVAILGDEATVKRFYKKDDEIKLIPENNCYQPIEVEDKENFSIAGKVIGVIRWF